MPNVKVTALFNSGQFGWSETYFTTSIVAELESVRSQAINLISQRTKFLGKDIELVGIRLSWIDGTRGALLINPAEVNQQNAQNPATDTLWEAVLVGLESGPATVRRRNLLLRGAPGSWVTGALEGRQNLPFIGGEWVTAFAAFRNLLTGQANNGNSLWGIKTEVNSPPFNTKWPITAITNQADTDFFIVTSTAAVPAFTVGQEVILRGIKGVNIAGLRGRHRVIQTLGGGQYVINVSSRSPGVPVLTAFGTIAGIAPSVVPIRTANALRWVIKKTGRAFFATRGRASAAG